MASEHVKEFNEENFDAEVLRSDEPVLVDFWAEWCMPCRMLAPTIGKMLQCYRLRSVLTRSYFSLSSEMRGESVSG